MRQLREDDAEAVASLFVETFGDARPGEIVLYEDAYRNVAVAINRGNAAEMFAAHPGQTLALHLQRP
jgi:S-adenosylmethionine hydrolase